MRDAVELGVCWGGRDIPNQNRSYGDGTMSTSEFLSICAEKHCNSHLDTRFAKPHPTIKDGHLCLDHQYMASEPVVITVGKTIDPTETRNYGYSQGYFGQIVPWTDSQLDRLRADVLKEPWRNSFSNPYFDDSNPYEETFNRQFNEVFKGEG